MALDTKAKDRLLSVAQLADKLACSKKTAYVNAANGVWPSVRIGRSLRFSENWAEQLIEESTRPATAK
jgi:excisionase family DNA binding protein